jgi:hypothetical protein
MPDARRSGFLVLLLTVLLAGCAPRGDQPDRTFDTHVAAPAFTASGPRILFDEGHHNWHRAGRSYSAFVKLAQADGYRVGVSSSPITPELLRGCDLFMIVNAVGTNERNDGPAFTAPECDALRDWVSGGGALLLIVDHYPMGDAVADLAGRFQIRLSRGEVEDTLQYDPAFERTHIVYSRENGGLTPHPITEGRNASERIARVLTFTGEAVQADSPAVVVLRLSPSARARAPKPVVEHRGSDVLVNVTYGDAEPVPGWGQGVALPFGSGRVVVLGEAAMLTAQFRQYDHAKIGMNVTGYDNRQLALNLLHWLSRVT